MTREESLRLLHSVYEDIKNMTKEDIDDFNNTVREYKKEQIMTKKEAITRLENIRSVPSMFIDEIIKELVEAFKQPPTLADILGWEEGQEYEIGNTKYKVEGQELLWYGKMLQDWVKNMELLLNGRNIECLRQAKKIERPKPKAWHVKDEYSFNCLIKELVEKGYTKTLGEFLITETSYYSSVKERTRNYIYLHDNDRVGFSHELVRDGYDLIEYHKEEPRYLLQTDLTSENGIQYLSFDKKRRKYFIGALMASNNVQQKFTDDEITKIKTITRFAKLCKKVKVE